MGTGGGSATGYKRSLMHRPDRRAYSRRPTPAVLAFENAEQHHGPSQATLAERLISLLTFSCGSDLLYVETDKSD
jgi:hypothetical protein